MRVVRDREPLATGLAHVAVLRQALDRCSDAVERADGWGRALAGRLRAGGRLIAAGNGGSAAQAQHLTAELVGRYRDDRPPLSAIALHADTSSLTAIGNDYDADELFARQLRAHGRPGDVFVALSTSGSSRNVIAATRAAAPIGVMSWALTGPAPNPLAAVADEAACIDAPTSQAVQETHLVLVHVLCAAVDVALGTTADGRGSA